jgi:hypothetical protein
LSSEGINQRCQQKLLAEAKNNGEKALKPKMGLGAAISMEKPSKCISNSNLQAYNFSNADVMASTSGRHRNS